MHHTPKVADWDSGPTTKHTMTHDPLLAPSDAPCPPTVCVPWYAPIRWLGRAAGDFWAYPIPCVAYGLCFATMGLLLGVVFRSSPSLMLTLMAGFLLIGPFLAMGLYEVARCRARGLPCSLASTALVWRGKRSDLAILGVALGVILAVWARASMVVLAISLPRSIPNTGALLSAFMQGKHLEVLVAWTAVGAVFALLVYIFTVIAIPMMLDQGSDAITAMLASARAVSRHPLPMTLWAALIVGLTIVGFASLFLGLVVTIPWIGLASWHAYQELRDTADSPPLRQTSQPSFPTNPPHSR
jgi:uncharacterized membrane protein